MNGIIHQFPQKQNQSFLDLLILSNKVICYHLYVNFQMLKKIVQQQLLSHHCAKAKKLPKNGKLNLFGKAISVIDKIPSDQSFFQSIFELDLSHNAIHEIHSIQQFHNLQLINLSHNRILNQLEILKLEALPRLQVVYVKGNPFLKDKMSSKIIAFLTSVDSDVEVVSSEIASIIQTLTKICMQNGLFSNYLNRIEMHMQLLSQYQMEENFINTNIPMFPKIKKIFQGIGDNNIIKKSLIRSIKPDLFCQQKQLTAFLKGKLSQAESKRSELIKRIYERQELLRNLRSTYNIRVNPKRTVQRSMINPAKNIQKAQIFSSPPKFTLRESVGKVNNATKTVLTKIKNQNHENSPPKGQSELLSEKNYENYEQYFMGTLIKMNPLYHLLHSPLNSLKSHEKQLLIQNLTTHLKEKMKEILKLEKKDGQYIKSKEQMNELQQYCKQSLADMQREVQRTNQKLKKMSKICQEQSDKIDTLCQQITTKDKELQLLTQENQKLKNENKILENKVNIFEVNIKIQDQIRQKKQQKIKQKYFYILQHKSYHFNNLKKLRAINKQTEQMQYKSFIFQELSFAAHLNQSQRELKIYFLNNNFQKLKEYCIFSKLEFKKIQAIKMILTKQRKYSSFQYLIKYIKKERQQSNIINNFRNRRALQKKRTIFNSFLQVRDIKFEENSNEKMCEVSKRLNSKKYFKIWVRYCKQLNQSIDTYQNKLVLLLLNNYLQSFKFKCSQILAFNASKIAVSSFLIRIRLIKSYFNFSKSIQTTLTRRKMKSKKIQLIRQHRCFYDFVAHLKDRLIQKKIIVQQELYNKKLKQSEKGRRQQQKIRRKIQRIDKLRKFCNKNYYIIISQILKRDKSLIILQKHRIGQRSKKFYTNLRTNCIENIKLRSKQKIIKNSIIITKKMRLFFSKLSLNHQKIHNMQMIIGQSKLLKSFFRWKSFVLWSRMSSFQQKYIKLQPQIAEVGLLQKQIQKQRELLLLQIEEKNRYLADLQRKCEEYQFVIDSKDAKYEKLKQIYAQALYSQELNSTVKLGKQRQIQEELCRKYLPNRTTRHSNQNTVLSSRPNLNHDRTIRQERQQQIKNRGKDSFLSSFKRF